MEIQETPTPTPAPRKSALPYVIGAGIVVLLAAAAFVAVKYIVQPKNAAFNDSGGPMISMGGPGGGAKTFKLNIKPAKELPATDPDVRGLFVERKDNSLFIGTGNVTITAKAKQGEQPKVDANFSGPKVEVVISAKTIIYKDTTKLNEQDPGAEVQQTLEPSTIDEITQQSSITVWGRKVGDRYIADVIFFSSPFMMKATAPGKP